MSSVADPKLKFRIRFRIRIRPAVSFESGSGFEAWIWIRIRNWPKLPLFVLKFLRSLIFKHKKSAIPQLRDLATNKLRNKFSIYEDLTHTVQYSICILHVYSVPPNLWLHRGKISPIEGNAKCRYLSGRCLSV
jgi:hypothetical protein